MNRSASLLALGALLLGGCDLCGDDPDCSGTIEPIGGHIEDFSLDDAPPEGVSVRGPRVCDGAALDAYAVDLVLSGSAVADAGGWMVDRLRPALQEREVFTGWGLSDCYPNNVALIVHDWADAEAAAQIAHELATEDDVTVSVLIAVEALAVPCAETTCEA